MNALVTGASGFIGAHLCRRLVQNGDRVTGISRRAQSAPGIAWKQADLADGDAVYQLVSTVKPDVLFHLASEVTGSRALEAVLPTFRANLASTVHLLTAAAETGCGRVVLAGSLEEPDAGSDEAPCSPYAAAKGAAAGYAKLFWSLYKLPVVTARLFMVYGPAQGDSTKIIPYMIQSLLKAEAPKLSSGLRPVDWVYVEDVVEGLLAAASASGLEGQTLDIGSGELVTIRAMVEELVRVMGSPVEPLFGALPDRPFERVRAAEVQKTWKASGWKPKWTLSDGLRSTADWYRQQLKETAGGKPR